MTFDRFYSIIAPHKAGSFNTVTRAKKCIVGIVILSFLLNIPYFLVTVDDNGGVRCFMMQGVYVEVYYWLSFTMNFLFPFISLLTMNSFIIHTLRKRVSTGLASINNQSKDSKGSRKRKQKSSESQIYMTLLLVTFGFLILTTPPYVLVVVFSMVEFNTPRKFALYFLLYQIAQKAYVTNNAINFFFYVISGKKFRTDLLTLVTCSKRGKISGGSMEGDSTVTSHTNTLQEQ